MFYNYYYDPTYLLVILGVIICAVASMNVRSTFRKYSDVSNFRHISAEQCAARILASAGITDVRIEHVSGSLTDHYSPKEKVLRLSDSVYGSASIAAIGVAAHECGHAIQHQVGYAPLKMRSLSVPLANIGSWLSFPLIIIGLIFSAFSFLVPVGIFLFSFVVLFQLITLPVEFNASNRAIAILDSSDILNDSELAGAKKVLTAAALTYVAALFSSILQLLRLVLLTNRRRN